MARIPDIERRLENWARWLATGNAGRYAGAAWGEIRVDRSNPWPEAPIPTNEADAVLTDHAVAALEHRLQRTVVVHYTHGGTVRSQLAELGGMAEATLHSHIDAAHKCLDRWFRDRETAAAAERERVMGLQAQHSAVATRTPPPAAAPAQHFGSRVAAWLAEQRSRRFPK